MTIHIIWATALVLCFSICIIPSLIEKVNLKPTEEKYMTREMFTLLEGRIKQHAQDKYYHENSNKILIDEILNHLQVRIVYKDGAARLVSDIKTSEWSSK